MDYAISFILFFINIFFVFGITLDIKPKMALLLSVAYTPLYLALVMIRQDALITTVLAPFSVCLIYAIAKRISIRKVLIRYLILSCCVIGYQYISFIVKSGLSVTDYGITLDSISKIFYQIDQYILMALLYLKVGVDFAILPLELVVRAKDIEHATQDDEDLDAIKEFQALSKRKRIKTSVLLLAFQVFQLFCVLLVCMIGDRLLEGILILAGFFASGFVIKKRWHSNSLIVCTLSSVLMFYLSSRAILPANISMFMPIVIGLVISYSLYRVAVYTEEHNALKNPKPFDPTTCNYDVLIERCREIGLCESDVEFCTKMFYENMKANDAADYFHYEVQTVRNKKSQLNKRLRSMD